MDGFTSGSGMRAADKLAALFLCGGLAGRSFLDRRPLAARVSSQVLSHHAQRQESQDADQGFDGSVEFLKVQQTDAGTGGA